MKCKEKVEFNTKRKFQYKFFDTAIELYNIEYREYFGKLGSASIKIDDSEPKSMLIVTVEKKSLIFYLVQIEN